VYARKLTYNDEVPWPQNLGAVAIANLTFIIDTYHQIHINCELVESWHKEAFKEIEEEYT